MKYVNHPHLLSIFGIWYKGDLLIVGMELAHQNLYDRLREATRDGHLGIPFDELLEYMREAAKGIDFLNDARHTIAGKPGYRIVHRDIKPHNLLLVGGCVKVADFGLAGSMERSTITKSGGMTPAYAAPEFFEGKMGRYSDQYSLAVTYYQLRTGSLPFQGNQLQVMAGHLTQSPDLTLLPEPERDILTRALAKQPLDRWPSCRAFVEKLAERNAAGIEHGLKLASAPQEGQLILQRTGQSPGLATLRSNAQFTERIWPLVVEETTDHSMGKRYLTRDLGPARPGDKHPIRLGSRVRWSISWDQEAHLLLLDEEREGKVCCLCPSWFAPDTCLRPGRTVLPSEEAGCEPFVVTGIPGREHLLAIITKEPLGLNWMPADKRAPVRILSEEDIDQLLAALENLQPGGWTGLTTYCDLVA